MVAYLSLVTLVVPDYDDAIAYFVGTLGFELLEDTVRSPTKRWVRVAPKGAQTALLLAKADGESQRDAIGNQTGGRVALFLETDDFDVSYRTFKDNGVEFAEQPRVEPYGKVVVFRDPFGNKWDLIETA